MNIIRDIVGDYIMPIVYDKFLRTLTAFFTRRASLRARRWLTNPAGSSTVAQCYLRLFSSRCLVCVFPPQLYRTTSWILYMLTCFHNEGTKYPKECTVQFSTVTGVYLFTLNFQTQIVLQLKDLVHVSRLCPLHHINGWYKRFTKLGTWHWDGYMHERTKPLAFGGTAASPNVCMFCQWYRGRIAIYNNLLESISLPPL